MLILEYLFSPTVSDLLLLNPCQKSDKA
jgi:hypothetical protein